MPVNEFCPVCRTGFIERNKDGLSLHKVFVDSYSFGRAEYCDCCKQCEERQREESDNENDNY